MTISVTKSIKWCMVASILMQVWGGAMMQSVAHADGAVVTISRNDSVNNHIVSPYISNSTGMSFQTDSVENLTYSSVRIFASNQGVAGCTSGSDIEGIISKVGLYHDGLLLGEDTTTSEFIGSETSCVYDIAVNTTINSGIQSFDIVFDTIGSGFTPEGNTVSFIINQDSFPGLQTDLAVPVLTTDIAGSANGATLTSQNPGINTITLLNPANPQLEYDNGMFTGLSLDIQAKNASDIVLSGFVVQQIGSNKFGSDGYDVSNSITLLDNSGTVLSTTSVVGTGDIIFSNLNLSVLAGQTQHLHMMVGYSGSIIATNFQFGASYWDAQDMSGHNYPYNVSIEGNRIDILANSSVGLNTINSPASNYNNDITSPLHIGQIRLVSTSPTNVEQLTFINLKDNFYATKVNTGTLGCTNVAGCSMITTGGDGLTAYLVYSGTTVGTTIISGGVAMIHLDTPVIMHDSGKFFDLYVYDADDINSESETNKVVRLGLLDTQYTLDQGGQPVETVINKIVDNSPIPSQFDNLIYNKHRIKATTISLTNQSIFDTGANNLLSVADHSGAILFQTTMSVGSTRDATIHAMVFDHAVYGVIVSDYHLNINGGEISSGDITCTPGSNKLTCIFTGAYDNGYIIPAGASHIIKLLGDVTASSSTGDYITTSLNRGAANNFDTYDAAAAIATSSSIVWSDNATSSLTTTSVDWFTDAGIDTLPSSSWTFVRDGGGGGSCGNGATNYPSCDDNQIILTNLGYTQDTVDTNLYTITWDPFITGSNTVDVYLKNNTLSGSYNYINGVAASDGWVYAYFDTMGSYTIKLVPMNMGASVGPEQTITISHTINAPVITLNGSGIITIEAGDNYTDSGAVYDDIEDGTGYVIASDTVNTLVPGTYILNYNHSDNGGNAATTVTRTVIVQDTTAPIITLNGSDITVLLSGTYTEFGATWTDIVDGSGTTLVSGSIDTHIVGTYLLEYNYTDLAGNQGSGVSRMVAVSTGNTPSLILNGSGTITQEALTGYTDPGAYYQDIEDGTGAAVVSGSVNTGALGTYILYYDYTDLQGNIATQISRTVTITTPTCEPGTELVTIGNTVSCNSCAAGNYNDSYGGTCASCPANTFAAFDKSTGCQACPLGYASATGSTICIDTQVPTITLSGSTTIVIPQGGSYIEYGAIWSDNGDGTGAATISGSVNTSILGTYTIEYHYSDMAGNIGVSQFRAVYVVDQTIPIIALNGSSSITIEAGDSYTDSGASWSDNVDGTGYIVASGMVNTLVPGTYTLSYDYTDTSLNSAIQQVRTIIVQDTTAPVVVLSGSSSMILSVNDVFVDPGAHYSDIVLGTGIISNAYSGTVSTTSTGEYMLYYRITDAAGNTGSAIRTVYVISGDTPLVLLNGSGTIIQEIKTSYIELGATWMDTEDGTGSNVTISGTVNTGVVGSYRIEYRYIDSNSNISAPTIRTVIIQDTIAPIVTLNGSTGVVIAQGSTYNDPGAMWSDNADGTGVVLVSGSVNTTVVGNYLLTYQRTDLAGNLSNIVARTVIVTDQTAPTITLIGTGQTIVVGSGYTEQGALWIDNVDGSGVVMPFTGVVDTNITGSYTLYYRIVDIAGNNSDTLMRVVHVVHEIIATTPPSTLAQPIITQGGGGSTSYSMPTTTATQSPTIVTHSGAAVKSSTNNATISQIQQPITNSDVNNQIVTIKIGEDGRIIVIRSWENNNQPIVAKDLAQTQEVISTGSIVQTGDKSDQAIQLKPYWIITPEMLSNPTILQRNQPTWDATPRRSRWRLSSLLVSWD